MAAKPPTKEERKAASAVLKYYLKQARAELDIVDQEKPSNWIDSLFMAIDLMKEDPDVIFADYRKEYDAGR